MAEKSIRMKRLPRPDDAYAFVDDIGISHERVADDEAESFGEEFVATVTSGDNAFEAARDELVDEELGGPFFDFRVIDDDELEELAAS